MKTKQLEDTIRGLFDHDMKIMVAKNHDYASEEDALENFRDWGLAGFAVRIGDKYKRVKNIIQKGKTGVAGEPIEDAFRDLAVYCYLARVFMMEKKSPKIVATHYINDFGNRATKWHVEDEPCDTVCQTCSEYITECKCFTDE